MDLSSWESTIGATSSSFMSKVQQMTDSLTGKSGEDSNSKPKAIPFSSNPETSQSNDEVWLLGRKYFSQTDFNILRREVRSRLWFSYRKEFPPIGDSGMTSDKGWGCMLRCGQMVVAECLQRLYLGRDFRWSPSEASDQYLDILPLFADERSALFGVHQLSMVNSDEKAIGSWIGPNGVAQAIKKMTNYDPDQRLNVQVAMNNVLVISEIIASSCTEGPWKPLLLFVPVRLGINDINPMYFSSLKACFELEQCAGVIGGRPNHALFYLGYTCDDLICLDPHETQFASPVGSKSCEEEEEADSTYHTEQFYRWHMDELDPSIALCFFCPSEASFHQLIKKVRENINSKGNAMFEIYEKPIEEGIAKFENMDNFNTSDDEFEIL